MSSYTLYPDDEKLSGLERITFNLYMISALVLLLVMMVLGLTMRLSQATWFTVDANMFYKIMTMHGAGMVGTMGAAATAVMWFFLRKYVRLHAWAFLTNFLLFIAGALCIVAAVFGGDYAGGWTFLYPLPTMSMELWSNGSAALFMLGYLLIGVGMLIFYLDAAAGIIRVYGNLGRALGLPWLFKGEINPSHPKAVVASTMVIISNGIGILVGAVILVVYILSIFDPSLQIDALLAKNMIYWFGHMYINATIYMGVIAVYELLPRYSGRAYSISRPFIWSWSVSCLFVIVVYPHHLLMDSVQPNWMQIMGQIVSHGAGFPVFLVTAFGALTNIYRSGMKWKMPVALLILSVFGWAAGIVPAMIDGTIAVNKLMHNTQWVPGHFHFYLLLGVLPMVLGLCYHVVSSKANEKAQSIGSKVALPVYVIGGLTFTWAFLYAGTISVPRRFAEHIPLWLASDQMGSIGAILVIVGTTVFAGRIIGGLLKT